MLSIPTCYSKWPNKFCQLQKGFVFSDGRPQLLFHVHSTSGILLDLPTIWSVIQIVEFGLKKVSFTQTRFINRICVLICTSFPLLILPRELNTPKITHIILELWKLRIRKISLCKTDITLCQSCIVLNLSVCFPKVPILVFLENILHPSWTASDM